MGTLARRFALAAGCAGALVGSQGPEFAQQYRQRLGGALTELDAIVAEFRTDAQARGLDTAAALARLKANPDALAEARGRAMEATIARRDALAAQQQAMAQAGPVGRIFVMAGHMDPAVAEGAWRAYEPAAPVTQEGFLAGGLGFALLGGATRLLAVPFRRRRAVRSA